MTNPPAPSPAGWYPAPDGSSATWWWDGAQWTPPHPQPSQPPATTNAIAKLATATQLLLIVCGVLSIATIGIEMFGITAITGYLNGNDSAVDSLSGYDQMTSVATILSVIARLTTAVVWVLWQYRVAKQVSGRTRRSPGWHVGSWFVPAISLWFPYQNISDIWRAVGRSRPSWQILWWLCWLVSNVFVQISTRLSTTAETLEQFRVAMWMNLAGEILLLVAAGLAWLIVRGITQGLLERTSVPLGSLAA